MKYLELVNQTIRDVVAKPENLVLFGQNITAGSCIGGFTKGLQVKDSSLMINSTNSENSLCGFGFGMMINGISSIFFVKQLDFLILGIDHLVNTYNIIRNQKLPHDSSFTIMPVIMDSGYQGPQASFNNLSDMCSIARISGFCITTKWEIEKILSKYMISPGFRIIAVSQRLFKEELISPEKLHYVNDDCTLFQYSNGNDATIVCFNFSFPQGYELFEELKKNDINSSIFNVTSANPINWEQIIKNLSNTKKLIILDDSKCLNHSYDSLLASIPQNSIEKKIVLNKSISDDWLNPISDKMEIDLKNVLSELTS